MMIANCAMIIIPWISVIFHFLRSSRVSIFIDLEIKVAAIAMPDKMTV